VWNTDIVVIPFPFFNNPETMPRIEAIRITPLKRANSNWQSAPVSLLEYVTKNPSSNATALVVWIDIKMIQ